MQDTAGNKKKSAWALWRMMIKEYKHASDIIA